jgi:HAE1 family hydrophobic/amphiphilic exporter-1
VIYRFSDRLLNGIDHLYARALHLSLQHRPTVFAVGVALFVAAIVLGQRVNYEFQPTTDEGEVTIDAELAVGTRIESTEAVLVRLEDAIRQGTPEATMLITQAGGGGGGGGGFGSSSTNRGSITVRLVPKDERSRASDQIAMDLRRQLSGLPGVIVRARARPAGR